MKNRMKVLDRAVIGLIVAMQMGSLLAQDQDPVACKGEGCAATGVQFQVRTAGEHRPVASGDSADALSQNRRVEIVQPEAHKGSVTIVEPGTARVTGQFSVELPGGGLVWATEDPAVGAPELSVQTGQLAPIEAGRLAAPIRFQGYANYASFIERVEIRVFRAEDADLVRPIAVVDMPVANVMQSEWDGSTAEPITFKPDDELIYVTRAYAKEGIFDETVVQRIRLVTSQEHERGLRTLSDTVSRGIGQLTDGSRAETLQIQSDIYGRSGLRVQNIPVQGSRIRIQGYGIPRDTNLTINGKAFPIDLERKFVAEYLEPIGRHEYELVVQTKDQTYQRSLAVDVTGKYLFLVAIADVTVSDSSLGGGIEPTTTADGYDDSILTEGRLGFYLKGKIRGRYLITAQADTQERRVQDLFDGFFKEQPEDIFRRLDPDAYYPVYGDDSTTYRDIDTQGKLYVRVDWDHNQALWGNYDTGLTGTEYAQYSRSLYGGALAWRSRGSNEFGEPISSVRVFGSEAQTALGHTEFLGTGGSLYYLRHTDVLPGSDKITLEIRDRTTGRVESVIQLMHGVDYEIDELQGRLILSRPLAQITRESLRTLTRDTPLDGYVQILLADYEYVPTGFSADDVVLGVRGKQWLGDHVAIGGTYVDENRRGDDYTLKGADLTLRAGRGTYLKLEHVQTESAVAPIFYSDNGGLSFIERPAVADGRKGEASSVEARINLRELGWTSQDWSAGAWWRDVGANFSVARSGTGFPVQEHGFEVLGYPMERLSLYGRYNRAEIGTDRETEAQITADWRLRDGVNLGAEVRRIEEQVAGDSAAGVLAAVSYRQRLLDTLEVYGIGQYTLDDDDGRYDANNRLTVGAKYLFANRSSLGAEASDGSRGSAAQVNAEYFLSPEHSIYTTYDYSTDTTERVSPFATPTQNGLTFGQRWRIGDRTSLFNESQFLKDVDGQGSGISHTFGMDFYPRVGWTAGFTLSDGELDVVAGPVNRRAYSVSAGRTDERMQWNSKLEYRRDSGAEDREQWVTTNRITYKINQDWRIAGRINYADTDDLLNPAASAKLIESNIGFAWRPHDTTRYALFGKHTYLYDLASLGQESESSYDQRSQVLALEGIYQIASRWELAGKLATRWGEARFERGSGAWFDSRATFAAAQLRYSLVARWEALAEYRSLAVKDGGRKQGWLFGVDRELGDNFKIGVGYNFTDFSDDLTDLEYDHRGWFLNLTGYY
jgi:hypothetical protein